jgi:hypothetical protein
VILIKLLYGLSADLPPSPFTLVDAQGGITLGPEGWGEIGALRESISYPVYY